MTICTLASCASTKVPLQSRRDMPRLQSEQPDAVGQCRVERRKLERDPRPVLCDPEGAGVGYVVAVSFVRI
jgi:hypothetical protein